ncbi:MAG: CCA tRNA nucleotidyltransferase [Clostridia bacterium]|nr:CCA tRNA nucleotidyltransferase [Clostridia bacterium]
MGHYIPQSVRFVLRRLNENGFKAYPVGGCVRDTLLGRAVHDWDIASSARPDDIKRVFADLTCFDEGQKFGTVAVMAGGEKIEITTFRREDVYSDLRRPDRVYFSDDLKEDLSRRDFTVNALAFDESGEVIDCFGGCSDLERGLLRAVGDAEARFHEDALRIMRAIRFCGVLGFSLEKETRAAVFRCRGLLERVARERIYDEFKKLVTGGGASHVISEYAEVIAVFAPDISRARSLSFACAVISYLPPDFYTRLAALYVCGGIDDAAARARGLFCSLKSSREDRTRTDNIIAAFWALVDTSDVTLKKALSRAGERAVKDAIRIRTAAAKVSNDEKSITLYTEAQKKTDAIIDSGECFTLGALSIDGKDLIKLGFKPSPHLGAILDELLSAVIEGKIPNERKALLAYAKKLQI